MSPQIQRDRSHRTSWGSKYKLLDYQSRWFSDESQLKICSKSRRIGLSWTEAALSVLKAAVTEGLNTYYVGYNLDMARQFITDCAFWTKIFQCEVKEITNQKEGVITDEDKDVITFRIRFASGNEIVALSSRPANLRAKKGRIVIDEAAFHDQLQELLDAAKAMLIWGGQVSIISTHFGEGNLFNTLVKGCKDNTYPYSLHEITFQQAVKAGLYEKICLIGDEPYLPENEEPWIWDIYKSYGTGASQELDCIPSQGGAGSIFNREWLEVVDSIPEGGSTVRFWDMAATAREQNKSSCYTAGIKMRRVGDTYYIIDLEMGQLSPVDGDRTIQRVSATDGQWVKIRWELEGGSAGKRDEVHLKAMLLSRDASGVKPLGDKVTRARPMAWAAREGKVKMLRGEWNDRFLDCLCQFPKGIIDPVDASTGAFQFLSSPTPVRKTTTFSYG